LINGTIQRNAPSSSTENAALFPSGYTLVMALVVLLFFLWGMSNNLTDILVQQLKKSFELSAFQAQLVQTAVFLGYFFMALPTAALMRRSGYKAGMLGGLILFATGTLLFWPAAHLDRYSWMLTALFFVGCGSASLEAAANGFIAEAGPAETSERRLNLAQAFNPAGSVAGILAGTFFIFSGVELAPARVSAMRLEGTYANYLHSELMRVVPVYVALGSVVLLLAAAIAVLRLPPVGVEDHAADEERIVPQITALLRNPTLRAALIAQFCYCGAQIGSWSAFIPYLKQYTHVSERSAGLLLTANLIALTCGRFLSTALMRWVKPVTMMAVYAVINTMLVAIAVLHPGPLGAGALVATSFFMSVLYPTIFASGIKGLGKRTQVGGSLIVMSVVGGAFIPPTLGLIARHYNSYAMGYLVITVCYVVVALFAWHQHKRHADSAVPLEVV